MLEYLMKIRNFCDVIIKILNNNNKLEQKIIKINNRNKELESELKNTYKELRSTKKELNALKLKFYKQKDDYEWDKDCVYYLKCKEKGNRLCHVCKEKNDYMGGSL